MKNSDINTTPQQILDMIAKQRTGGAPIPDGSPGEPKDARAIAQSILEKYPKVFFEDGPQSTGVAYERDDVESAMIEMAEATRKH